MDQATKARLRPVVTEWVLSHEPGAEEIAPTSGQRFVFRTSDRRAIKLWPPEDDVELERCRREISVLARDLPGLPQVVREIEIVPIGKTDFAWYEEAWIDAPSLAVRVEAEGPSVELAQHVLTSGARVLAQLHELDVIHRDVSAGNILASADNRIFVVDLGLAKHLSLDPITSTGEQLPLTFHFASPEQIMSGSAALSKPTDVYSLAMVCMWVATGEHAFLDTNIPFDLSRYLARMAHRDTRRPDALFDPRLNEMIHPLALARPPASALIK